MRCVKIFAAAAAMVSLFCSICAAGQYQFKETRELVSFVREAAQLVAERGTDAFPLFRIEGGRWYSGNRYVFVIDMEGNRHVYPPDPKHERKNIRGLKDINGKPVGEMFIEAVSAPEGKGWVHYQWTRPHDMHPVWKSTYLVKTHAPSGAAYIVGSGNYNMAMEKAFIKEVVDDAAQLLKRKGKKAFAVLRDSSSKYIFKHTYVFVTSEKGVEVVNPAFPMLEGRCILKAVDAGGKSIVRDYIAAAKKNGSAWMTYVWPKPGESVPSTKQVYVKKIMLDGELYVVGSGIYTDWLSGR